MNESSDQEQEPDKGLAVVDTEIIEMLVENEPGEYISVDIVPIKSDDVINYTMHKNWVNVYEGEDVGGKPVFQFEDGANVTELIGNLIEYISQNVNVSDDKLAIRFIVSYAESIFYINAIKLINMDAVQPPIPGGDPNDGGLLVSINLASLNVATQVEAERVAEEEASRAALIESERVAEEEASRAAMIEAERVAEEEASRAALIESERVAEEQASKAAMIESERIAEAEEQERLRLAQEKEAELVQLTNPPKPPQESYADIAANLPLDLPTPPPNNNNASLTAEQQSEREEKRAIADKITADYEEEQRVKAEKAIEDEKQKIEEWKKYEANAAVAETKLAQAAADEQSRLDQEAEVRQMKLAEEAERKRLTEQQRSEYNKAKQQEKNKKAMIRKQEEQDKIKADNDWFDAEASRVAREKAAEETAKQQDAAMVAASIAAEAEKKKIEYDKARQLKKEEIQRQVDAYKAREATKKAEEERAAKETADKLAAEKAAAEKLAAEKLAADKLAADKAAAEKAAADKAAAEKAAAEKLAADKAAAEKLAADKAAAEKLAADKAAAEKAAADKLAADKAAAEKLAAAAKEAAEKEQERLRVVKEKAAARISAFVANKRAQQEEIDETWRDSESDIVQVNADEELVEKLATKAQVTENLKQIRLGLDSIIKRNRLIHEEFQPDINNITSSFNDLNAIIKNNQGSDIIANLGLEDNDNILTKLSKLFLALDQKRNAIGVPTYSISQKTDINEQSKKIVVDIDNILRQFSNDESNTYPILPSRRQTDDVKEELVKLKAAKPGTDELEDIEIFTNKVGEAVLPVKEVTKSTGPVFKPRSAINITNMPAPPVNATPSANPPLPPPAKAVTAKALTPRTNPARSNVFERLSQTETVASHIRANEEQKQRKKIEAKHWADINARPHGGKSTQKKSRKSSHTKRHTKRAMPKKQQPKTRNKRTKRGHNQTRKK